MVSVDRRTVVKLLVMAGLGKAIGCKPNLPIAPAEKTTTKFNPRLSRYLEAHPNVVQAMSSLSGEGYYSWDESLKIRLAGFYTALENDQSLPLGFTGRPPTVRYNLRVTRETAQDIALAFLAQSLWVEIEQKVPWRLHEYDSESLSLLLDGRNLFESNVSDEFLPRREMVGLIMPANPTPAYQFMLDNPEGGSLIRETQRETVFALVSWMMSHLVHAYITMSLGADPDGQRTPIIELMTSRTVRKEDCYLRTQRGRFVEHCELAPRYWSPSGCHSAAGFMVLLLKVLNIPSRVIATLPQHSSIRFGRGLLADRYSYHSGIAVPSQDLYLEHTDNIYMNDNQYSERNSWSHGFSAVPPEAVFLTRAEFEASFNTEQVGIGVQHRNYVKRLVLVGARQPTYPYIEAFHRGGRRGLRAVFTMNDYRNLFSEEEMLDIEQNIRQTIRDYGGFANIEAEHQRMMSER